jgi:maleate isomerase
MGPALHHSGLRRVDLVSPYLDWKNEILISFLEAAGVSVNGRDSFATKNPTELGQVTADLVRQKALAVARDDSEGMLIACVQLPTIDIIPELTTKLKRPVWSAVRAAAWAALSALSLPAGRLVPDCPPHRAKDRALTA